MAKRIYPHLTDATDFPNVSPIQPYAQYENTFDYDRWTPGTKLYLLSVPWDNSRNIVEWADTAARNQWIHEHAGETMTLTTLFNRTPDGSIKLPYTLDVMNRYNYLWVERPKSTGDAQPLPGETDTRVDAYGFFIVRSEFEAPSTTRALLDLDVFTTYRPYITFTYCQLERGHAPLAASDVDEYLHDPAHNNQYLLCDDVNYGREDMTVRGSKFVPFGEGVKCVMFASTMSPDMLAALPEAEAWEGAWTKPTYSDTDDRWGYQYQVNGYDWRFGDMDYSNVETPTDTFVGDIVPNGYHMYMVEAADAKAFFMDVVKLIPQLMSTIGAMWMIAADMVDTKTTITTAGHEIHVVDPVNELPDIGITLTRDMFAYPDDYAELAKLYTSPYADLHVSDNNGTDITIRIETLGEQFRLHRRVSLAYPYLKAQTFLTGVNGYGTAAYSWTRLDGTETDCDAFDAQWTDYMMEFDIPTYSLTFSGSVDWAYRNQRASIAMERLKALNTYHVTDRNVNTAYENTLDTNTMVLDNGLRSAQTALDNATRSADNSQTVSNDAADTAKKNTNRSNDTGRKNAGRSNATTQAVTNRSALTAKVNAQRAADTAASNAQRSAGTAKTNAQNAATVARDNAQRAANASYLNTTASNATEKINADNSAQVLVDNTTNTIEVEKFNLETRKAGRTADMSNITGTNTDITNSNNNLSKANLDADIALSQLQYTIEQGNALMNMASSALGAIPGVGGAAAGAASAIIGGMVSMSNNAAIQAATVSNNTTKQTNAANNATANTTSSNTNNDTMTQNVNSRDDTYTERANTLNEKNTGNTANMQRANAANTKTTGDANAQRTKETANTNATNTYNMSTGNAQATANTANTNAQETANTANANAQDTYNTATANSQEIFETAEANAQAAKETGNTNAQDTNEMSHRNSQRNRDTAVANATATKNTTVANLNDTKTVNDANAHETRESNVFAAKTALEQAQDIMRLTYAQHTTDNPVTIGSEGGTGTGDATADILMYRGTQFRVRTQPEGAIRQAGDQFLRYGYRYEGNWDITTLNVMPKFSYWQTGELWFDTRTTILENGRQSIRGMFGNGVTVWRNPEDIGRIGIHDNK